MNHPGEEDRESMMDHKVTCVATKDESDTGITQIGAGVKRWTVAQAISEIKAGTSQFHTLVAGDRADVVVRGKAPNEYLTTSADGKKANNLLSLSPC